MLMGLRECEEGDLNSITSFDSRKHEIIVSQFGI